MSGEEDRRALKWRREKWRRQWIARFAERQHIRDDLVDEIGRDLAVLYPLDGECHLFAALRS